ncbi:MAG: hypothetical protein H6742_11545 [Alphaproteobacteria bacterium]|nr:hypothetical protein [Alphaproteobacteria bacterium]
MTRSTLLSLGVIAAALSACGAEARELGAPDGDLTARGCDRDDRGGHDDDDDDDDGGRGHGHSDRDDHGRSDKVEVCHVDDDTGEWAPIEVSERAVDKHLDRHGDWLVGDEVCGDGIDNDCDGDIDEDCCPLFDDFGGLPASGEFDGYEYGYTFASDNDPSVLYTYTDVYFYGWATDGSELRFSVDFYDFGTWYEPTYGDGYQYTTWTYTDADGVTSSDSFDGEISADEYATCTDAAFAWSDAGPAFYSWDNRDGI